MAEILLLKTASGAMVPVSEEESEKLRRFKVGATLRCDIHEMRNGPFFRKWWALVTFAFGQWSDTAEMPTYKGQRVQPAIQRFRKDITIMAGYFHVVADVNGNVHLEADSISFANMVEETFEALYSATINVVLQKILPGRGYTEQQLRALVDQVLEFA